MRRINKYVFTTEQERKADYIARVGPLRKPRTNTVEPPDRPSLSAWWDYLRAR